MKEGQSYINHQLNTSLYRNSCKFSKADRFKHLSFTYLLPHSDLLTSTTTLPHKITPELPILDMDKDLASKIFKVQVQIPTMSLSFLETKEQLPSELIENKLFLDL